MDEPPSPPPSTFAARLRHIGPGILLAVAAIGSGELILTPRAGALFGLSVGWVIVVSIVYKLAITLGNPFNEIWLATTELANVSVADLQRLSESISQKLTYLLTFVLIDFAT